MKAILKNVLYQSGVLKALHRRRNRNWLTVLMFHRVLPAGDPAWAGANPTYTVSTDFFDLLLGHINDYYNPVSLEEVREARFKDASLPDVPLLVTFDDGWADNFLHARPILKRHSTPALFFLATGAVRESKAFWQERLFAWALSPLTTREEWERFAEPVLGAVPARTEGDVGKVIAHLEALGTGAQIAEGLSFAQGQECPKMMSPGDVASFATDPLFSFGAHGTSHTPLTKSKDLQWELETAQADLRDWLGLGSEEPLSLSFPHGQYDAETLQAVYKAGYDLVFDSRQDLSPKTQLRQVPALGRFEVRPLGKEFDRGRIAAEMAFRPHATIAAQHGEALGEV